ncbi:MAG TPA: glycine oxidase ThiO [Pyrinomonadaceae bacterium]|nr:glycine oxidase ThiO [Pyrinomonadaceae bacterium]
MRNVSELPERADVAVLGGGIIGLSVARELARGGAEVVLLERGAETGAESSWAAAGMLAPQVEADRADEFFKLAAASRDAYPDFARELEAETGISVELEQTGTLYLAFTEEDERECERRFAWQTRAGLRVERLTAEEVRALEPQLSTRVRTALRFPLDCQVENRRLVSALAKSCELRGVSIYTRTEARAIKVEDGRAAGVETSRGRVRASSVLVACGAWSSLLRFDVSSTHDGDARVAADSARITAQVEAARLAPRIEPVRGQMLCFAGAGSSFVRHVVYSPRGYLVPRRDGRLLAGTTTERAGFDKSLTDEGRERIETYAREIAPGVAALAVSDAWAGLRPRGADDWPVMGASADVPNLFYATGHYRNGILLAPLTGAFVAEMIRQPGNVHPLLEAFAPERFRRAASSCAV